MTRRFWIVVNLIALILVAGNFVSVAIACALLLVKHRDVPTSYPAMLVVLVFLGWVILRSLLRKFRTREAEDKTVTTT